MNAPLSPDTQAILLLTAPLVAGRSSGSAAPLTQSEYARLAGTLRERGLRPRDLLETGGELAARELPPHVDVPRVAELLARGFRLSQAIERWSARSVWVVSRADAAYPDAIRNLLRDRSPPVLYGCGSRYLTHRQGLAVVGSREVDERLAAYARNVGARTARADLNLVSGGARGIDTYALSGAIEEGGCAIAVLADSLEKAAIALVNRKALIEERLLLISPYDPAAGFHRGHAMQRNKLIYALSAAALVVNADLGKGGTWTGAVEQLEKLRFVPVYVRPHSEENTGLSGLVRKGARLWPEPATSDALRSTVLESAHRTEAATAPATQLPLVRESPHRVAEARGTRPEATNTSTEFTPSAVLEFLQVVGRGVGEREVADRFAVGAVQARRLLRKLVATGEVVRSERPQVRYRVAEDTLRLF
jgi:DNA processing protein